jgi:NAD(P)-dependent dehydrogenase (short-subunit alcohol dehydrogenase family)
VRDPMAIQALWDLAISRYGKVDIWINNAGLSGPIAKIWELDTLQVQAVIETNILGTIYGSQVAVKGMMDQGFGAIYNMEGMGSDGRRHTGGLGVYGMSKYGLNYFNKCLADELKGSPIILGMLRPGMVMTEFVTSQFADRPEEFERAKRIFNIIADRVETVTPWLAEKILVNQKSGATISWSNSWKMTGRFLISPFKKRDLFGK